MIHPSLAALADAVWTLAEVEIAVTRAPADRFPAGRLPDGAADGPHPLVAVNSFIKSALIEHGLAPAPRWFFHPSGGPLPGRILRGNVYRLEIVLPGDALGLWPRFAAALAAHSEDRQANHALRQAGQPRLRRLAGLLAEQPDPPKGDEACLEFVTPLPFRPRDRRRRWLLSAEDFGADLSARLEKLFGCDLSGSTGLWRGARGLPWFWTYREQDKKSRSNPGTVKVAGCQGPYYLRGDLAPVWPLLLLGAELHAGRELGYGLGAYRLGPSAPCLDRRLAEPTAWRGTLAELRDKVDVAEDFPSALLEGGEGLEDLRAEVLAGRFSPAPARGFRLAKDDGGERMVAELPGRERVVHQLLNRLLTPVLERMFEDSSIGFRPGRSREIAKGVLSEAFCQGFGWILETDVESFFDQIDWPRLDGLLADCLPRADRQTLRLLAAAIRQPVEVDGAPAPRERGLVQGSPLSPLLANLFLDPFDEGMHGRGHRLVRFGDDLVVPVRSRAEAEAALADATALLAGLGLSLKASKTAVRRVEEGFTFLGYRFGCELEETDVARIAGRRPVYVTTPYAFVGLDGDSLVVRRGGETLERLGLARVGEVVVLGGGAVSARLLERLSRERIPVSFCSQSGRYAGTFRPDSRRHFEVSHRHGARWEESGEAGRLAMAKAIVAARIESEADWLRRRRPGEAADAVARLEDAAVAAMKADSVEALRGHEGEAAKLAWRWLAAGISNPEFASRGREPRRKLDRFNALYDFCSFLLFTRLNVLVRAHGLNPYLGFLHSHADNYESLVCDLQEPFRNRLGRLAVKVVNLGQVSADQVAPGADGRYLLGRPAMAKVVQAFEREMSVRLAGDPGTWGDLLHAQVQAVVEWAVDNRRLALYQPPGARRLRPDEPDARWDDPMAEPGEDEAGKSHEDMEDS